jgi:hypothetical protein
MEGPYTDFMRKGVTVGVEQDYWPTCCLCKPK